MIECYDVERENKIAIHLVAIPQQGLIGTFLLWFQEKGMTSWENTFHLHIQNWRYGKERKQDTRDVKLLWCLTLVTITQKRSSWISLSVNSVNILQYIYICLKELRQTVYE